MILWDCWNLRASKSTNQHHYTWFELNKWIVLIAFSFFHFSLSLSLSLSLSRQIPNKAACDSGNISWPLWVLCNFPRTPHCWMIATAAFSRPAIHSPFFSLTRAAIESGAGGEIGPREDTSRRFLFHLKCSLFYLWNCPCIQQWPFPYSSFKDCRRVWVQTCTVVAD